LRSRVRVGVATLPDFAGAAAVVAACLGERLGRSLAFGYGLESSDVRCALPVLRLPADPGARCVLSAFVSAFLLPLVVAGFVDTALLVAGVSFGVSEETLICALASAGNGATGVTGRILVAGHAARFVSSPAWTVCACCLRLSMREKVRPQSHLKGRSPVCLLGTLSANVSLGASARFDERTPV
jgi:hypothetical protein